MLSDVLVQDFELRRKRDRARMFPRCSGDVKEILTDVGVSEIGRGIGVHPSTISRIFNGEVSPRLSTLEAIATYLSDVKDRRITVHDVIDLIHTKPWAQPLNMGDIR